MVDMIVNTYECMCVCTENFINLIVCDILVCKWMCVWMWMCVHMDNELAELLAEFICWYPFVAEGECSNGIFLYICDGRGVLEWKSVKLNYKWLFMTSGIWLRLFMTSGIRMQLFVTSGTWMWSFVTSGIWMLFVTSDIWM